MADFAKLHVLAQLASAAYLTTVEDFEAATHDLGLADVLLFQNEECQAFTLRWNGYQVVDIRGTQFAENTSIEEIGDNLFGIPIDAQPAGYVHEGYYAPLLELWPEISAQLTPSDPVIIVGHSMGGVRAHQARSFLPPDANVEVVSFGAPKGASFEFWNAVYPDSDKLTRVAHSRDFAPCWPPEGLYHHPPGKLLWLHDGIASVVQSRPGINLDISDHSIDQYVASLAALANPKQVAA